MGVRMRILKTMVTLVIPEGLFSGPSPTCFIPTAILVLIGLLFPVGAAPAVGSPFQDNDDDALDNGIPDREMAICPFGVNRGSVIER